MILRHGAAMEHMPSERMQLMHAQTVTGPFILSAKTAAHPEMTEIWRSFFDGAQDAIGIMTVDTDGRGIHILAPTPHVVQLRKSERQLWEMMAAHVASGVRLRRALESRSQDEEQELPFGAEAVIDPSSFRVSEATNQAKSSEALESLRQASIAVDQARVNGREPGATEAALSEWWALIRGRWSIVDWFDTDSRRYVLAVPNPPRVPNPRGLTKQEQQVLAFAALGDSHKLIGYRLGLSRSRVSHLISSAMRKLSLKTQAQLVERIHAIAVAEYKARHSDGGQ